MSRDRYPAGAPRSAAQMRFEQCTELKIRKHYCVRSVFNANYSSYTRRRLLHPKHLIYTTHRWRHLSTDISTIKVHPVVLLVYTRTCRPTNCLKWSKVSFFSLLNLTRRYTVVLKIAIPHELPGSKNIYGAQRRTRVHRKERLRLTYVIISEWTEWKQNDPT